VAVARIIYGNHAFRTGAVASASSLLTNRPPAYALHPSRSRRWVSASTFTVEWIAVDFLAAQTISAFAIVDYVGKEGAPIVAQTSTDGISYVDFATFSQPSPNPSGVSVVFGSPISRRYARILFQAVGSVATSAQLGVFFVGDTFTPGRDVADNAIIRRVDPSLISSSVGGQEYVHDRQKFFQLDGRWPSESDADEVLFRTMFETVGSSRPMIFSYDSDKTDRTFYSRMTSPYTATHQLGTYHDIPFTIQELR
jgi:hypothetical protein